MVRLQQPTHPPFLTFEILFILVRWIFTRVKRSRRSDFLPWSRGASIGRSVVLWIRLKKWFYFYKSRVLRIDAVAFTLTRWRKCRSTGRMGASSSSACHRIPKSSTSSSAVTFSSPWGAKSKMRRWTKSYSIDSPADGPEMEWRSTR